MKRHSINDSVAQSEPEARAPDQASGLFCGPSESLADSRESRLTMQNFQNMANNSPGALQLKRHADMTAPGWRSVQTASYQQMADHSLRVGQLKRQADAADSGSPVQRETRPNNTGLPDQLKSGIESLSGMSMDHVKVHYNSDKPAQLQAHAYAQGNEIHLAPGQERHLPHEAWHVVQQAEGRVRSTLQMNESAVNDDPSLESEADRMGEEAAKLKGDHDAADLLAEKHVAAATVQSVTDFPIQRSVGFEFESSNTIADAKHPGTDLAKDQVYESEDKRFRIDADTRNGGGHNIEFVTKEKNTFEEVRASIMDVVAFAENLEHNAVVGDGNGWKGKYRLSILDSDWEATVQHTEGVLLTEMDRFLEHSLEGAGQQARPVEELRQRHTADNVGGKVSGLVQLVMEYVRKLQSWDGKNNDEGPKNAGVVMSRTDFHSMYQNLNHGEKAAFQARVYVDLEAAGIEPTAELFKHRYLQYLGGPKPELATNPMTVHQWIRSIREGTPMKDRTVRPKDLLSPPEGYEGFHDPAYSMGALGMDGDRVIIEVRDHGEGLSNLKIGDWPNAPELLLREETLQALGFVENTNDDGDAQDAHGD